MNLTERQSQTFERPQKYQKLGLVKKLKALEIVKIFTCTRESYLVETYITIQRVSYYEVCMRYERRIKCISKNVYQLERDENSLHGVMTSVLCKINACCYFFLRPKVNFQET